MHKSAADKEWHFSIMTEAGQRHGGGVQRNGVGAESVRS